MNERTYSVAEANALLPQVRSLVRQMLAARARVLELQPELWPAIERVASNGGGKAVSEATQHILLIQQLLGALQHLNVLVKDINTGLVDFPALRDDQLVYLCWQYDEPSVQFWHDVDSGFAGRQRIDETF